MRQCLSLHRVAGRLPALIAVLSLVVLFACGGGGGGDGSSSASIDVLEDTTFLLNDGGADPRTGQKIRFILRGLSSPGEPLTEDEIEFRRDGELDVEARVRVNPPDVAKSEITLILDVSSSLTGDDLRKVKASAEKFAGEIVSLVSTLRIYYFSSPSKTLQLGEYRAGDDGFGGLAWTPDPVPDIESIPGGDDSTALFHVVRKAIVEDDETSDLLVVFSDGQENSSPQGAREEALGLIEDGEVVVFSVGFGDVDRADLRALSDPYGEFLGVRPSLDGLFDEVGQKIQSVYTVVYDTPTTFGDHKLEMRIKAGRKSLRYPTEMIAGIDLAKAAYGRYPSLPGSTVELMDFSQSPAATLTYTVLPADQAKVGVDGLFAFAVEPTHACPGEACQAVYQGPYGEGARSDGEGVYLPEALIVGETWNDPVSSEEFTFAGFETIELLRGTGQKRQYRCAKVTFAGGTHWFAPQVGLVRTKTTAGEVILDLASPPCLSDSFDGGCEIR